MARTAKTDKTGKRSRRRRRQHVIHQSRTPGAAPGTVRVDPRAPKPQIQFVGYGPKGVEERSVTDLAQLKSWLGKHPVAWVNVIGLGDADVLLELGQIFGIHRLALEDVVNVDQRAKVERFDEQLFIVTRHPQRRGLLDTEQISIFVGKQFVVTFQEWTGDCFDPVRERIRLEGGRIRERGADYLAYALIDAVIDSYFPIVDSLVDALEIIEQRLLEDGSGNHVGELHHIRRDLLLLRRSIWPHRDAINMLLRDRPEPIQEATTSYLRDCYDHTLQIVDILDSHQEVARGLMDLHLNRLSHRMNEVMRVLTVVATIFIPLTFIAGIYGMNFDPDISPWNMPALKWRYGYPMSLAVMAFIAGGMCVYFYRKGWLRTRGTDDLAPDPPSRSRNTDRSGAKGKRS